METGPDYELLKDAYAIIDGVPEAAIDLEQLCSARGPALDDGTICSPAGWLARHPSFQALGLSLSDDDGCLHFRDAPALRTTSEIMAQVFGLQPAQAEHLFGQRDTYTLGDDSGLSDKRLWLREMREFLREQGQLDEDAEERLETRGPFAEPPQPGQARAL